MFIAVFLTGMIFMSLALGNLAANHHVPARVRFKTGR